MTTTTTTPQLILYRGWDDAGRFVWSPFVTKLEFRLRHGALPHTPARGSVRTAPGGKIPYVDLGPYATTEPLMGDSTFVTRHLIAQHALPDLNAALDTRDAALDAGVRALLEDKLYFFSTREKWQDNYYVQRDKALEAIPWPARVVIGNLAYRRIAGMLVAHGVGRYSREQCRAFKREVWARMEALLVQSRARSSSKDVFWCLGGESATEADASLFAFAVSALVSGSGPEMREIVKGCPAVLDYVGRIRERYFADYKDF